MIKTPRIIVDELLESCSFCKWLGIEILEISEGSAVQGSVVLRMKVRKEMTNSFGIAHGGIVFSLADTAIAFAANSFGIKSVTLEASLSLPKETKLGDLLLAKTKELSLTKKTAIFDVNVTNQDDETVGLFRGIVYRTSQKIK